MFLYASLLTPFDKAGRVDLARARAHVLWLAAHGVDGFVATASEGEYLYLSAREREALHRTVLDAARGRSVFPCVWDPSPATTQYLVDAAREQGAAGMLLPPPLHYELDDHALRSYYESVPTKGARLFVYQDPRHQRSVLSPHLYAALRQQAVVAGMFDCGADPWRLRRTAAADHGAVYAGGDALLADVAKIPGVAGFASTLVNVWPAFCLRLFRQEERQLGQALVHRVNRVASAGGIRALKSLLRMGCRAPLVEPPDAALTGLPAAEGP